MLKLAFFTITQVQRHGLRSTCVTLVANTIAHAAASYQPLPDPKPHLMSPFSMTLFTLNHLLNLLWPLWLLYVFFSIHPMYWHSWGVPCSPWQTSQTPDFSYMYLLMTPTATLVPRPEPSRDLHPYQGKFKFAFLFP